MSRSTSSSASFPRNCCELVLDGVDVGAVEVEVERAAILHGVDLLARHRVVDRRVEVEHRHEARLALGDDLLALIRETALPGLLAAVRLEVVEPAAHSWPLELKVAGDARV
jgi:hypothetical protein